MALRGGWIALVMCALAAPAVADPASMAAEGEELAKQGRYSEAIEKFKAADREQPRASHVCLIALAYTRRELWPQAEIFLDLCHRRATSDDPLPEWVPTIEKQLGERLATVDVAPVELVVEPPDADATLTVSSFAPDEAFAPRTIHLPPGAHTVIAKASGYASTQETIEIADRSPKRFVLRLQHLRAKPPTPAPSPAPSDRPSRTLPWIVIGAGASLLGAGAAAHLLWLEPARDHLIDAQSDPSPGTYARWSSRFDTRRGVTIGLYAAGTLALAAGVLLRLTVYRDRESRASVAVLPRADGGVLAVEWR